MSAELGNAGSDADSDTSDEESAGNMNNLGPKLLITKCDFIPYFPSDESDDNDESEYIPPPKKDS